MFVHILIVTHTHTFGERIQIFRKKYALRPEMMEDLDWDSFEGAYKSQTHGTKTFLTKFLHGQLPYGDR
jgi:hypothetical protein